MSFNLTGFFVRRWQFTLLVFALLAALGLNALRSTTGVFPIRSRIDCCTGCGVPSRDRPSTVVTLRPATCHSGV